MTTDTWKPRRVFVPFQFQYKEQRKQVKTMDAKTYQECALKTMADQNTILHRLTGLGPKAMQLDNGARGLADDAGEVSGVIKKYIEYGQPLDVTHLKEELGDCFWRMRQICDAAGITFEECFQANYDKLNKVRYKDGYSDDAAKEENRDREAEREAMTPLESHHAMAQQLKPKGLVEPWLEPNEEGEKQGDICCQRATGKYCYEHDPQNYAMVEGIWLLKMARLPDAWDKDPYIQNGQGFAEQAEAPANVVDWRDIDFPSSVHVELKDEQFVVAGHPPRVRKPLNHSYTRYCTNCNIQPIHKTNTSGICTDCFVKHVKPKETENDTATTG